MRNYVYVFAAIIAGIISILPYLVAYQGVDSYGGYKLPYLYQDSELVYLSRIREVTEGHRDIASPFFTEYKDIKSIQQPFGEWLYALLSFGKSEWVPTVSVMTKFLFPAIFFILVYLVIIEILQGFFVRERVHEWVALGISSIIVLGYDFVNMPFIEQIISGVFQGPILSLWTRLVYPIVGAFTLFGSVYFIITLHKRERALRTIGAGLLLGFSAGYIFSFALGMVFAGCMFCFALIEKDWGRVKSLCAVITISLLINAFYIFSILTASRDPAMLQKSGLLLTHQILHNKVFSIATFAFFLLTLCLYIYRQGNSMFWKNRSWQVLTALLLSGFICLNEQVLTGKTVWPGHFVQYTNPIGFVVFFLSLFILADTLIQKRFPLFLQLFHKGVMSLCVVGMLVICIINFSALRSVSSNHAAYQDIQRYVPVLTWLNENAPEVCTVFVEEETERLEKYITAYTHCDVYHSTYVFSAVPEERILHNYVTHLRLRGIGESELPQYLDLHERDMREYFFADWADKFSDGNDEWVFNTRTPESMAAFQPNAKAKVIAAYKKMAHKSVDTLLHTYAINYVVFDNTYDVLSAPPSSYVVFEANELSVLEVK